MKNIYINKVSKKMKVARKAIFLFPISYFLFPVSCFLLPLLVSCCSSDDISSQSIFDTSSPTRTEFDQWIKENFTDPYNIEFNYLYNDKLSDNTYNVVPATIWQSKAMAILLKHVWCDAYTELLGEEFLKANSFRQIQLIGSPEYDTGSITLGTAEGGLKILLFRVNELDTANVYICLDNPYRDKSLTPLDLNYWYFHTMHHEYCHILTQRKNYSTDFQTITPSYNSTDWINFTDQQAAQDGFVSAYGSSEYNEDFAETYSTYVTFSPEGWQKILKQSIKTTDSNGNTLATPDSTGYNNILNKVALVRQYMEDSWGIDIDSMRSVVTRRSAEASTLDLTHLKKK